jgi:hypothetical protein
MRCDESLTDEYASMRRETVVSTQFRERARREGNERDCVGEQHRHISLLVALLVGVRTRASCSPGSPAHSCLQSSFLYALSLSNHTSHPQLGPQLVLATLAFFNGPSRAYVDHWTGDLYGAGGVERGLSKSPKDAAALAKEVVGGGVIMSKLGNATAK